MFRRDGDVFRFGTAMAVKLLRNAPSLPVVRLHPVRFRGVKKQGAE